MATFFPHLYEYCKLTHLVNESEKRNGQKRALKMPDSDNTTISIPKRNLTFDLITQSKEIDFLIYLEFKAQRMRESTFNPMISSYKTLEAILQERTQLSDADKYRKPSGWPLADEISTCEHFFSRHQRWMVIDTVLCVEIAKILPFFEKLYILDQQEMLKEIVLMNSMLTLAFYSYVASSDVIVFPDGYVPIFYPNTLKCQESQYQRIVEPIKRIKVTKEEYVMLKTIIFCSAKSESISDEGRKLLQKEFHRYSNLLLKYSQAKLGAAPGAVRFSQLISIIEAMIHMAQKSREIYTFLAVTKYAPPLKTITLFDQLVL